MLLPSSLQVPPFKGSYPGVERMDRLGSRSGLAWGCIAFILGALCQGVSSKVVTGEVALNNGTQWSYLTKFSYSQGSGNFTLDVKPGQVRSESTFLLNT